MSDAPIPNAADHPRCGNCETELLGEFCYACGQPRKGMIRHLQGVVADFFDSVFNLDSRTLRTIGPLLVRPGFLSTEYFAGRRTRYVTPLRLYVFLSVIAFLAVAANTHVIENNAAGKGLRITVPGAPTRTLEEVDRDEKIAIDGIEESRGSMPDEAVDALIAGARTGFEQERKAIRRAQGLANPPQGDAGTPDSAAADSALVDGEDAAEVPIDPDDPNPSRIQFGGKGPWHPETNPLEFSWASPAINDWINNRAGVIALNADDARKHPGAFVNKLLGLTPQALLLALPIFALMLKLFYVFKRRLYMEHLIVALHSHSFLCFSILLLVIIDVVDEWVVGVPLLSTACTTAVVLIVGWIPVYLLLAQKRVYQQGWLMTFLKYFFIGMGYIVLLAFAFVLNLLWALAS